MPVSGNRLDRESYESAAARASSQQLTFDPKERSRYVRSMVALVLQYRRERKTVDEIKERVPEFAEAYKHLFEMITAPEGFDQRNLDIMLAMLDRMGSGSLSQHEASVLVGKRLFDQYGGAAK